MNTPEKIIEWLENNLIEVDWNESRVLLYIKTAIGICSSALLELREWVNQLNFTDRNDEIYFFKVAKPHVLIEYLFYSKFFEVESKQPVTSKKARNEVFGFAVRVGVVIMIIIIIRNSILFTVVYSIKISP